MNDHESCANFEETKRKRILGNTCDYLENYLNPERNWDKEITPKQRIDRIRYANVNWKIVSEHIKGMDYGNFLRTPYWKAIAAHAKYRAGFRCQLCNSANNLVTHHRNYGIHGFEHAYMQELIVLCDSCHNKFHNRIPERRVNAIIAFTIIFVFFACYLVERMYVFWR